MYRGGVGQWVWLLHRITGVAVVYFLCLHIFETLQLIRGVDAYDAAAAVYHQPWFRPFEFALVMAVVYHALNGVRLTVFDYYPHLTRHRGKIFRIGVAMLAVLTPAIGYFMMAGLFRMSLGEIFADMHGWPYAAVMAGAVVLPVLYLFWRGTALSEGGEKILSPSESAPAPTASRFEKWAWLFMRVSGILLLIFALSHVFIMHIERDITEVTGEFVVKRFLANPLWIAIDLTLLFLAWVHGLNGLRIVLTDYMRRGARRRVVLVVIALFGLVWLLAGGYVLFIIPSLVI